MKFDPCVGGGKAPINPSLLEKALLFPGGYLRLQDGKIWNTSVQALTRQNAQLYLCHIQPATMFWRVTKL
jgi:hypothetical protein